MSTMKITILGSGTSTGVPVIGCDCAICKSKNPKNKRLRSSVLLTDSKGRNLVIDTSPDFREQMLAAEVKDLNHVIYTHTHADHSHGFDDLRAFSFGNAGAVNCYSSPEHLEDLKRRFYYAFEHTEYIGAKPVVDLHTIGSKPFRIFDWQIETLALEHGGVKTLAFKIGSFAYATDFKSFTDTDIQAWKGKIHTMVASGIRFRPHPSHSTVQETLGLFQSLDVKQGVITHISHEVDHDQHGKDLPKNVVFAYDGMVLNLS